MSAPLDALLTLAKLERQCLRWTRGRGFSIGLRGRTYSDRDPKALLGAIRLVRADGRRGT